MSLIFVPLRIYPNIIRVEFSANDSENSEKHGRLGEANVASAKEEGLIPRPLIQEEGHVARRPLTQEEGHVSRPLSQEEGHESRPLNQEGEKGHLHSRPLNQREGHVSRPLNQEGKEKGHIKRPMNSFMLFSQQRRRQLSAECPGMNNAHISVLLGAEWSLLNARVKALYAEQARILKAQHTQEYPGYRYKPRRPRTVVNPTRRRKSLQRALRKRNSSLRGSDVQSVDQLIAAKLAYFQHRDQESGAENVLPEAVLEEVTRLQCLSST
ncbi:hypothetical protein ACOMHN_013090 [Nucella lapillus]